LRSLSSTEGKRQIFRFDLDQLARKDLALKAEHEIDEFRRLALTFWVIRK
jgi:hypothetical protein